SAWPCAHIRTLLERVSGALILVLLTQLYNIDLDSPEGSKTAISSKPRKSSRSLTSSQLGSFDAPSLASFKLRPEQAPTLRSLFTSTPNRSQHLSFHFLSFSPVIFVCPFGLKSHHPKHPS